uniref:Uncharacterized protein n=1 Tax=Globisporangium ultimum (strain ATCC 200006 / CBS 805.95 / DAOM BR144) TaxID=431595 RepID=K3WIH4_GLOUD
MWSSDAGSELFAPTIVVEADNFGGLDLSSPSECAMDYKLREYYFEARGVQLAWVIDLVSNTMIKYTRQDGASEKDVDGVHRVEITHWRDLHGQAERKRLAKMRHKL